MPVEVKGALALRKALRTFTPDLAKQLPKEMAIALKPVVKTARGYAPSESQILSRWRPTKSVTARFPTYDAKAVKAGISYKTTPSKPNSYGFRSLARLFNKTAAGSIYEIAGRINPDSVFVKNIRGKDGSVMKGKNEMEGRVLYRAYEEDSGKAQDGVIRAIEKVTAKLNERTQVRN
jgi:hypothetical protein